MPADTPKYGGSKFDLLRAAGKVESVQPIIDEKKAQVKAVKEEVAAEEQEAVVEERVERATRKTTSSRKEATSAIERETQAIKQNVTVQNEETAAVRASTEAWAANAQAKRTAAAVVPTGGVAGPVATPVTTSARAAAPLTAEAAATEAAAVAAAQVQAFTAQFSALSKAQLRTLLSRDVVEGIAVPSGAAEKKVYSSLAKQGLVEEFKGLGYGQTRLGEQISEVATHYRAQAQVAASSAASQVAASKRVVAANESVIASNAAVKASYSVTKTSYQTPAQAYAEGLIQPKGIGRVTPLIPDYRGTSLTAGAATQFGESGNAKFAYDDARKRWLVKQYADENKVASELLANSIYRDLGVPVPQAGKFTLNNKPAIAYPTVAGRHLDLTAPSSGLARRAIGENLAADALIGNYDFLGNHGDNILFDAGGNPIRLDPGGAFTYKGMSGTKEYTGDPESRIKSMQEYNKGRIVTSPVDLREQKGRIAEKLNPERIGQHVAAAGFTDPVLAAEIERRLNEGLTQYAQYAKGTTAYGEQIAQAAKTTSTTQVVSAEKAATAEVTAAEQIAAAQRSLIASYDLSYGRQAALADPGKYNLKQERFYQRLYGQGLITAPTGGQLTKSGGALAQAIEAQPGVGRSAAAVAIDEALAYKVNPLLQRRGNQITKGLYNYEDVAGTIGGKAKYGYDKAQLTEAKKYIEERSRAFAELEGLTQGGRLTGYRAGGLDVGGDISRFSARPIPYFERTHKQAALPYNLSPAALRGYGPAVLRPGYTFEEEMEMTVSTARAKKALAEQAAKKFDEAAALAATQTPGAIAGLGAAGVNDLLLTRLQTGAGHYSGGYLPAQASRASLIERGLAQQDYAGKFKLSSQGGKVADELLEQRVLGYRKYQDPAALGASGSAHYSDAYPGIATAEQKRALTDLERLQGSSGAAASQAAKTQVTAAEQVGAAAKVEATTVVQSQAEMIAAYHLTYNESKLLGLGQVVPGSGAAGKLVTHFPELFGPAGLAGVQSFATGEGLSQKGKDLRAALKAQYAEAEAAVAGAGGGGYKPPQPPKALYQFPEPGGPLLPRGKPTAFERAFAPIPGIYPLEPPTTVVPSSLPRSGAYIGGTTGPPTAYIGRKIEEDGSLVSVGQFDKAEQARIATHRSVVASLRPLNEEQAQFNRLLREGAAELTVNSSRLGRHGALSTEFIGALSRGEVTLKEFGEATVATIGKFGGWAVAGGLVYGAYESLKRITEGAKAASTGVTQLERAGIPNFSRDRAYSDFLDVSRKLNVPIGGKGGVAEAQFYATRAGFRTQPESRKAAETAILAEKLDLVPIQEGTKSIGALHVAFGLTADQIQRVFQELDVGQLRFNARLQYTFPQLGRASASIANAGGDVHELTQQLIAVVGATGGGGGQGGGNPATLFIREAGNLRRPVAAATLRELVPDIFRRQETEPNITRFNKELAQRASSLSPTSRARVAEAIGGGSAIGGRYAIALINAGPSGRLREIEHGTTQEGPAALKEDLDKKLAQFDERVHKIGISFERLGVEIGQIGLTTVAESVIGLFGLLAGGMELLARPLGTLGAVFTDIPKQVQEAAVALGAFAVAGRIGRSQRFTGASRTLSEIVGHVPGVGQSLEGYINHPDRSFVRDAGRTISEDAARITREKEQLEGGIRKTTREGALAVRDKERITAFEQSKSPEELNRYVTANPQFTAQREANQARITKSTAKLAQQTDEMVFLGEQELLVIKQREIINSKRLSIAEKAAALEALPGGFYRARTGTPFIEGSRGPAGSAFEAARTTTAGEAGGSIFVAAPSGVGGQARDSRGRLLADQTQKAPAAAEGATASRVFVAGLAADATIIREGTVKLANATEEGAVVQKTASEAASANIEAAGVALSVSFKLVERALQGNAVELGVIASELGVASRALGRAAIAGVASVGGKVAGGAAGFAGLFTKESLFKGFNTALFGSLAAELVGGAVGGKAGSDISGIGTGIATGAGIGLVAGNAIPIPGVGAGIGAVVGGVVGGGLGLFKALKGGPDPAAAEQINLHRKQVTDEEKAAVEALKAPTAGKESSELNAAAAAYGEDLEDAFGEDAKKAQAAKTTIEKSTKTAAASLKFYGQGTPQGRHVLSELEAQASAAVSDLALHPGSIDRNVATIEIVENQFQTAVGAVEAEYQKEIAKASTPKQRAAVTRKADIGLQNVYNAFVRNPREDLRSKIAEAQKVVEQDSKRVDDATTQTPAERINVARAHVEALEKAQVDSGAKTRPGFKTKETIKAAEHLEKLEEEENKRAGKRRDVLKNLDKARNEATQLSLEIPGERDKLKELERHPELRTRNTTVASAGAQLKGREKQLQETNAHIRALEAQYAKFEPGHFDPSGVGAAAKKKADANKAQLAKLQADLRQFEQGAKGLIDKLREFSGEKRVIEDISLYDEANAPEEEHDLAAAGPSAAAKRSVEDKYRRKREQYVGERTKGRPVGNKERKVFSEEFKKKTESEEKANDEAQERASEQERHELAELPKGATDEQKNAVRLRGARGRVAKLEALGKKADPKKLSAAQDEVLELEKGAAEAIESEAATYASAITALQEARDSGDALKQAKDKVAGARRQIALAKKPHEKVQAQANLIAAEEAERQARITRNDEEAEERESRTADPLLRDRIHLGTLKRDAKKAHGPDEKRKYRKLINEAKRKLEDDKASEAERETDFLKETDQISSEEAVRRNQKTLAELKKHHAAKAQIQGLESKIFKEQNEGNPDFNVGNIKVPTLLDVRRQQLAGTHAAAPLGFHQLVPPTEEWNQTNQVTIQIVGSHAQPATIAEHVVKRLNHETHRKARAHRRSRGFAK